MKKNEKSNSLKKYNKFIIATSAIGMLLSVYAFYVEVSAESNHNYSAMCDISEHMSCSKVFTSEYGKGFGVVGKIFGEKSPLNQPNGILGIIFYGSIALLSFSDNLKVAQLQLGMSLVSIVLSFRLAYILYYILYDFCVVCVSTYVVNVVNTILTFLKTRELKKRVALKKNR